MYPLWQIILVSLVPGLLWLWYFYRQDAYEPEPGRLLLLLFGLGMASVLPAFLLELPWRSYLADIIRRQDMFQLAVVSFALIGVVEETVKAGVLYLSVKRLPEYDEPLDGIIYGVTVGLGFAALENLLYAMGYGPTVGIFRAVITSLAHASFTGWLGFYLTVAKYNKTKSAIFKGWGLAVAQHGAYNLMLMGNIGFFGFFSFMLVAVSLFLLLRKIGELEIVSPFRPGTS